MGFQGSRVLKGATHHNSHQGSRVLKSRVPPITTLTKVVDPGPNDLLWSAAIAVN